MLVPPRAPARRSFPERQYPSFANSAMTLVPASSRYFNKVESDLGTQTIPTLIVNTKTSVVLLIGVYKSAEASGRSRSDVHSVNLPSTPAFAVGVGQLSDNVFGVEVIQANLSACKSGPRTGNAGTLLTS